MLGSVGESLFWAVSLNNSVVNGEFICVPLLINEGIIDLVMFGFVVVRPCSILCKFNYIEGFAKK